MLALSTPGWAQSVSVAAAGDLQLGTGTTPEVFEGIRSLLQADLRIINLEGPITARGRESGLDGDAPRFAAPPSIAERLEGLVDVVSLANNHALDQGELGFADTRRFLNAHQIAAATSVEPAVIRRSGLRITVLARYFATSADLDRAGPLVDGVRSARSAGPVLVSIHWPHGTSLLPPEEERRFARALIDAGASAVLGHGPHAMRGIELRGRGVIAYSLGNFAFSCSCTRERDAYVLRFRLGSEGAVSAVEALPIQAGLKGPPAPGDPQLAQMLTDLSSDLGSKAVADGGMIHLTPRPAESHAR